MRLLDIGDAAECLGTTERHMRALIANRKIDYIKVGRLVRFDPSTLDAWIRAQHRHGGAMKSESPAPKGPAITSTTDSSGTGPARQRRWPNGRLKYAAFGLEVFPVDPDTKAPIGRSRPNGHLSATKDRPTPIRLWWTAPARCPIGCRIPERRGRARHRPPPRRPRHLGHHRRRSRSTGHTPSRFRPQRRRFSHLVSEPRTVTNSRTVTESTCCTRGTDTAFCRHRYTQKPASRTPGFTTRQHRWRTYRNG